MVGLINLFIYVLKYPSIASVLSDVAALDVVVGHFGHLEMLSASEISYPFAREIARIAYEIVKKNAATIIPTSSLSGEEASALASGTAYNFNEVRLF